MGSESSGGELQRAGTAYNLLSSPVEPQGQAGAVKKNDTERQPVEGPRYLIGANISRDQAYLQAQSTVEVGNQGAHAAQIIAAKAPSIFPERRKQIASCLPR